MTVLEFFLNVLINYKNEVISYQAMPYTPIESFKNIDISKHAFIEASAGTGKTYTIENLVIRFLTERQDLDLENILLVTFTEKATCELKLRIREKLEMLLHEISDKSVADKIKTALDSFDSASIYTIHGFCQGVLKDYALENKAPFQWEIIDDRGLFQKLLKEQIRKTWPAKFGETLTDILIISGFSLQKARFELSVIDAAKSFHPNSKDLMKPDIGQLTHSDIVEKTVAMRGLVQELKNISDSSPFCHGFDKLNGHKAQKNFLWEKIIAPLGTFLTNVDCNQFSLQPLINIIISIDQKGPKYLQIKYLKKGGANPEVCPHWQTVQHLLEKIHDLYLSIKDALQALSILQLQQDAAAEKLKNGWISFDDMLSHVQKAVFSPGNPPLVNILRKKFKVAFVDEFQDTDPVQWNIFKKIFLEEHNRTPENLLFLIGDPKQAIYAFRGADVYAYLSARKEMENLERKGYANCYCLTTNWRSEPQLIRLFNQLFCSPDWFSSSEYHKDFEIDYLAVQPPDAGQRLFSITQDHSDRGFLNIIDLSEAPSVKGSKLFLAKFIAEEINRLTCPGKNIRYRHKDKEETTLSFGDICILVRGKNDMPFLEDQFNRLNIPYSYYKKPGLFFSREAFHLSLLFHAISEPANMINLHKALLTPFFNFKPENLHLAQELAPAHPIKQLLFKWNKLSFSKKWSPLFQSLMEDSGLIFRESTKPDWERTYTNYRQILEHLQEAAYLHNLDFRALTALLDSYRKGNTTAGQDADLHQIETEDLKVQIMTMHVAKGLEYPVVFVFGGLTQRQHLNNDFYVYHEISGQPSKPVKVFDLSKTPEGKNQYQLERQAEDKRLYYVALTRARLKLYVPYYEFETNHGWVGPVCRLVTPALKKVFGNQEMTENGVHRLKTESPDTCDSDVTGLDKRLSLEVKRNDHQKHIPQLPDPHFLKSGDFSHRVIQVSSFSSLHHMASEKKSPQNIYPAFSALSEKPKEDDESFASGPKGFQEKPGTANDIPGGTETGSMFHDILENISFDLVLEAVSNPGNKSHPLLATPQNRELIETHMDIYQIDHRWIYPICDVILNTLTTPVSQLSETFFLAQLKKTDRVHEAEFYFPYPLKNQGNIPEITVDKGFIRGFIDLVFKYEDKFYIADWKSNVIEEGYSRAFMEKSMAYSNYHLQYKIYTVACVRWLRNTMGSNFDPEKNFGGVFYFYLRGMDGTTGNGIYYVPPTLEKDF